jgi:hypothetical protein
MNTADSGPGSLRDIIGSANPGDTITFSLAVPATITLKSGQITINKNLTIAGPGANLLTISGNLSSRIFAVPSGQDVSISGVSLSNGSSSIGGAISNQGTLSLTFCAVNGNTAASAGAILNEGTLSVANCTFTNNSASGSLNGGAIENTGGILSATNCTFSGNFANAGGAYKFTRCSDGFMISGTGVAKVVNGIQTLTDFRSNVRLSAGFNLGQRTGNATIYLMVAPGVWQTFRIVDTNPFAICTCQ